MQRRANGTRASLTQRKDGGQLLLPRSARGAALPRLRDLPHANKLTMPGRCLRSRKDSAERLFDVIVCTFTIKVPKSEIICRWGGVNCHVRSVTCCGIIVLAQDIGSLEPIRRRRASRILAVHRCVITLAMQAGPPAVRFVNRVSWLGLWQLEQDPVIFG
jgi:hypothetical protein